MWIIVVLWRKLSVKSDWIRFWVRGMLEIKSTLNVIYFYREIRCFDSWISKRPNLELFRLGWKIDKQPWHCSKGDDYIYTIPMRGPMPPTSQPSLCIFQERRHSKLQAFHIFPSGFSRSCKTGNSSEFKEGKKKVNSFFRLAHVEEILAS